MFHLRLFCFWTVLALLAWNDGSQAASLCVALCCCTSDGTPDLAKQSGYNQPHVPQISSPTHQQYLGSNHLYPQPAAISTYHQYPGYAALPEEVTPPTYQQYPGYYQPPANDASQILYQQYSPQKSQVPSAQLPETRSEPSSPQSSETSSEPESEPIADTESVENSEENSVPNNPETSARLVALPSPKTQVARTLAVSKGYPQPQANANVTYPGTGIYKVHKYGSAWYDALARCASEGATLAVPSSKEQVDTITSLFNPDERSPGAADDTRFWIGIQERATHGEYFTVFGEWLQNAGYAVWSAGQPNDLGNTDCVSISTDGTYSDDVGSTKLAFVCEKVQS